MPKRLFSHCLMPGRRVRQKVVDSDEEVVEASTSASARGPPTRNRVQSGGGLEYVAADSPVRFTSVGSSDEETDLDTNMLDPGVEQDAQKVADSDEERVSSRSVSSRLPTPGPSRSIRKRPSEVFVAVPSRHPRSTSRSTRRQTEAYDDDVVMNDGSAIMDRSAGLMTPRITRTPSSSAAPPPDDDDEDMPELYDPPEEETLESEELVQLLKEINTEEEEDEEDEQEDLPIRFLDDFALYEATSSRMVPFWELVLESPQEIRSRGLVASGVVSPRPRTRPREDSDSDSEEEELDTGFDPDDVPRIQLSDIQEVDCLWWYGDQRRLDDNIWIRTDYAWYILRTPIDAYATFIRPFSLAHYIVYAMAEYALSNPRASLATFLEDVDSEDQEGIRSQADGTPLDREECEAALKDIRVLHIIDELRQDARPIRRTALFRNLKDPAAILSRAPSTSAAPSETEDSSAPPSRGRKRTRPSLKRRKSSKNPELAILEHKDEKTVLTPLVSRIAEELLHFKPARDQSVLRASTSRPGSRRRSSTIHDSNPEKIVWGRCSYRDGKTSYYDYVKIDGVRYKPGDLVMVEPGADPKKTREQASKTVHTTNLLGHKNWFARIEHLHDDGGQKPSFHARWFAHSSKTLLQEFSHPNELFWLKECSDCELSSILQKCTLDVLPATGAVGEELDGDSLSDDHFFHRNLYYDEDGIAWTDLPPDIIQKALDVCEPHRPCVACGLDELDERHDALALLDDDEGFVTGGVEYHPLECVYLYADEDPNGAFELAQIMSWKEKSTRSKDSLKLNLTVRYFHRRDDLTRKERLAGIEDEDWDMDERHIFLTGREEDISSDRLAGKFYLRRRAPKNTNWLIDNPDVFYCTHQTELAGSKVESAGELEKIPRGELLRCDSCFEAMMENDKELREVERLNGLELFAGAGGFSKGMEGMVDTRWSIEFSHSAARTLKTNHPDSIVYQQDVNKILQRDLDLSEGKECAPLLDNDGMELPPLPKRGEVDIIYGGPPCQSFSKANHFKKDDDPRSMLALVLLSYVERLEPDYVIIENVVGFVEHKATLQDGRQVAAAMVKIVARIGLALGYQVHARVLQAAQSGVAQGRRRFIIIMARRGLPLPQHPIPTHVHTAAQKANLPTGQALRGLSRATHGFWTEGARSAYYDEVPSAAPHRTVTIEQAIGDLPKFHWQRPGVEINVSKAERQEEADLRAQGIPVIDAISTKRRHDARFVGFEQPEEYGDVPRSNYQRVMRSTDDEDEGRVTMHYSMPYTVEAVERVTAVPMRPGANWRDLPEGLDARVTRRPRKQDPNSKMLARLSADGVFATSMTSAYPLSKTGSALHYNQRRILTVRENARAQGFPDDYEFCSTQDPKFLRRIIEDQQRQIGNAVPVPLARALGEQSLRPAVLARNKLLDNRHDGSPEV